jgi:predicted phage baseplate assembly protein
MNGEPLLIGQAPGEPDDCGCCAGLAASTPEAVTNRPGLSAIVYRVGTHADFKGSMVAALSAAARPALRGLNTRSDDDFTLALLDAWATVADVLTFYQERAANECYLRTATERRSLQYLARLIGYRLGPGVAAAAPLAFTLEDAQGAPDRAPVPVGTKVQSVPGPDEKPQVYETVEAIDARVEWNAIPAQTRVTRVPAFGDTQVYLKGTGTGLKPGDALLFVGAERAADPGSERWDFRRVKTVAPDPAAGHTLVTWETGLGSANPFVLPAANPEVYALRLRAGLFGYNAPDWRTLPVVVRDAYLGTSSAGVTQWPQFNAAYATTVPANLDTVSLDAVYPQVVPGSWLVLSIPSYQELYRVESVAEGSRTLFSLTAKTTDAKLSGESLASTFGNHLRETVILAQSEKLEIADEPVATPVSGASVVLGRAVDGLVAGRSVGVSGQSPEEDRPVSEAATLLKAETVGGLTKLTFDPPLSNTYRRDTFAVNANVARATHGETVEEVLGGGDPSRPFQRFALRQPPLTYVSAATPSGRESTLQVRVNDLLWDEVPTLYDQGPRDRAYTAIPEEDGGTSVQYGDGVTGARPPAGPANVRALYRKGIGLAGRVKTGQLSQLMTRPLGVKGVINPGDATGGEDPESPDDARRNAPLTVLTLDRVVSPRDYEDFARAFAGVAKALATWSWTGAGQGMFVTVAGPGGDPIPPGSDTYKNLLSALRSSGDPYVPVRVQTYREATFRIAGTVHVDTPRYLPEKVRAAVEKALRDQFSFDARSFGQPVTLGEVIAAIQAVPGVVFVDIDSLYRSGPPALNQRLQAALPEAGPGGEPLAAELLTLDPGPLTDLEVVP